MPQSWSGHLGEEKDFFFYQDLKAGPFSPQPNRYIDHATPALIIHGMVFNLSAPFAIVSPLFHSPMCHFLPLVFLLILYLIKFFLLFSVL